MKESDIQIGDTIQVGKQEYKVLDIFEQTIRRRGKVKTVTVETLTGRNAGNVNYIEMVKLLSMK